MLSAGFGPDSASGIRRYPSPPFHYAARALCRYDAKPLPYWSTTDPSTCSRVWIARFL